MARFVPSEKFYDDDTKKVLPNLFESAGESGMSVTRVEMAGSAGLAVQQANSNYVGYVVASAKDIRAISHNVVDTTSNGVTQKKQVFAIYDTALAENKFHGDVCQTIMNPGAVGIKLRLMLRDAFDPEIKNFTPPSAVLKNHDR